MTAFRFDAEAALKRAREGRDPPTLPTLPTREAGETRKVGTVGKVGTVRAPDPELAPEELARDLYEEHAAIREFCGGQDRATAERAAWQETQQATGVVSLAEWRRKT